MARDIMIGDIYFVSSVEEVAMHNERNLLCIDLQLS